MDLSARDGTSVWPHSETFAVKGVWSLPTYGNPTPETLPGKKKKIIK